MPQKLADSLLHCEFCRFATFSEAVLTVHIGKCHEEELANEAAAKKAREFWEAEKRAIASKKRPGYLASLVALYGKDYFICPTCLRPSIAAPTPAHPQPGVCHNYYWHDWAKEARELWAKGVMLEPWLAEYLTSETEGPTFVVASQGAML